MGSAPAIWTPPSNEESFFCLICGEERFTLADYQRHVVACAHSHEGELARYSESKHPDFLFKSADPEYREWQRKTGKLI